MNPKMVIGELHLIFLFIAIHHSFTALLRLLVDILLHTGRTHQIRVQFSSRKMPLYGDGRYGGGSGSLALFAHTLEFTHPVTNEKMTFSAKPDTDCEPWNKFEY